MNERRSSFFDTALPTSIWGTLNKFNLINPSIYGHLNMVNAASVNRAKGSIVMLPVLKVIAVGLGTCFAFAIVFFLIISAFDAKDRQDDKVASFIRNLVFWGLVLGVLFAIGSCLSKSKNHGPTPFDRVSYLNDR